MSCSPHKSVRQQVCAQVWSADLILSDSDSPTSGCATEDLAIYSTLMEGLVSSDH